MQKRPPRPSRSRTRSAAGQENSDDTEYLRSLLRSYEDLCPKKLDALYLVADAAAAGTLDVRPLLAALSPLLAALFPPAPGWATLWRILAETFGLDRATPEERERRKQRVRAMVNRPRRKRQGRARKRNYDERVRTTQREIMHLWSAARAKLSRQDRADPAVLARLAESLLARYRDARAVYKQTAAQQAKKQIDKQIQRLRPANR